MRLNVILRYVGMVVVLCSVMMLASAAVAWGDSSFNALLLAAVLSLALGVFPLIFVEKEGHITSREAYIIVLLAWVFACFVGMFPYLLWRGGFTVAEAWFESVSGFTTTGATAIENVDRLPHGLLFWRAATHWIGGVGVVMFALVVLPSVAKTKLTLSSAELSSLAKDNYRYRSNRIAQIVLLLYIGLTVLCGAAFWAAGMSGFDAVCHAFATVATGGFSTHTASLGWYNSVVIEGVAAFFMLLSGVHFGLLFATLTGRHNNILRSEVARFYLGTIIVASLAITFSLWSVDKYELGEAARQGVFHTISTITTTGFATSDTTLWTPMSIAILIFLMFQCGCAGSTSGGLKSDRIWLAIKTLRMQILRQQHPNAVVRLKLNGVVQDEQVVGFAIFFIVLYILIVAAGTIIISATGLDLSTSFTMAAASVGNVGPGFGSIGSMSDYAHITPGLKTFCTGLMLLGRLEIFGLIQLFAIKWWR